jgi:hypothetical protein
MNRPFRRRGERIEISLSARERGLLRSLPQYLDDLGSPGEDPATDRLNPSAHPDDAAADVEFREMVGDDLDRARATDRSGFTGSVDADALDYEEAQMWLRVLGDARLEVDRSLAESAEGATLHYLGYLQDALIQELMPTL